MNPLPARCAAILRELAALVGEEPAQGAFYEGAAAAFDRALDASAVAIGTAQGGSFCASFVWERDPGTGMGAGAEGAALRAAAESAANAQTDPETGDTIVAVPIVERGIVRGVLLARTPLGPIEENALALLEIAGVQIGGFDLRASAHNENRALQELALRDPLTDVANRRAFDDALAMEWSRAGRSGSSLAMVMVDVDFFGLYNTYYGHPAGDTCLLRIAQALAHALERKADLLARYGGEEFCAVLPNTDLSGAILVAERMRDAINGLNVLHERTELGRVTISLGVAAVRPERTGEPRSLVDSADRMLLTAKKNGRNRVAASGYESKAPANQRAYESRHNLPHQITRFVGREFELREVVDSLTHHRLVTLVGPGGVGKTRIAAEAARTFARRLADGALFVDLSAANSFEAALTATAQTLSVRPASGQEPADALVEQLAEREQLVVLDNCEQVIDDLAPLVERLLLACAGLRILATSRESLDVAGERLHRVEPMRSADAQELFVERLRAAGGQTETPSAAFAVICERLDNLPLAIELVAPRVAEFGISETLHRLDRPGFALTVGLRRNSERQQTVTNLVDWSYRLLAPRTAAIFCAVSVFAGGWDDAAGIAVCADAESDEAAVRDSFEDLERKSLIMRDPQTGRYRMLELTGQFARAQLRAHDAEHSYRLRHAMEFARRAGLINRDARSARFAQAVDAFVADWPNLAAALELLLVGGADPNAGALIAAHLAPLWDSLGRVAEAAHWLGAARAREDRLDPGVAGQVEYGCGFLANSRADHEALRRHGMRAAELFEDAGDKRAATGAYQLIANADLLQGNYAQARELLHGILEFAEADGDLRLTASALCNLGVIAADSGELKESERLYERAIDLLREMDTPQTLAMALMNLSETKRSLGDSAAALALSEEAIGIGERIGTKTIGIGLCNLAGSHMDAGDLRGARDPLLRALELYAEFPASRWTSMCFEQCARLAHLRGEHPVAAQLIGFIEVYRIEHGIVSPAKDVADFAALREQVRSALGDLRYARLLTEGSSWNTDRVFSDLREAI